jgi:hypothetical protein
LLLRLSGSFLLRFAERFQDPPRLRTIAEERIAGGVERPAAKKRMAQTPGLGVFGVRDPRVHPTRRFGLGQGAGSHPVPQAAPSVAEARSGKRRRPGVESR